MTKLYTLSILISCMLSCSSYNKLNPKYFEAHELKEDTALDIEDFDIYTYSICESYKKHIDPAERFLKCPDDFFNRTVKDSIMKVEELYMLLHKKRDLGIYVTTFSHKYIRKQKGFLNDSVQYKNKFYLRDTEYIYVGTPNFIKNSMLFERQKKNQKEREDTKMIWHFTELQHGTPNFMIQDVNIATVENAGNFNEKIPLNTVFSVPFNFRLTDYKLLNVNSDKQRKPIGSIYLFKNAKNRYDVIFKLKDAQKGYRFSSRKVLYFSQ